MCGATTLKNSPRRDTVSVMRLCERHQAVEYLFKVVSPGVVMTDLQLITEGVLLS